MHVNRLSDGSLCVVCEVGVSSSLHGKLATLLEVHPELARGVSLDCDPRQMSLATIPNEEVEEDADPAALADTLERLFNALQTAGVEIPEEAAERAGEALGESGWGLEHHEQRWKATREGEEADLALVGLWYDLAGDWVHEPTARSQNRWRSTKTGAIKYQKTEPGKGREPKAAPVVKPVKAPASSQKAAEPKATPKPVPKASKPTAAKPGRPTVDQAHEAVKAMLSDPSRVKPEHVLGLVDTLSQLRVADLASLREKLGLPKLGSRARKGDLIGETAKAATTQKQEVKAAPKPAAAPKSHEQPILDALAGGDVHDIVDLRQKLGLEGKALDQTMLKLAGEGKVRLYQDDDPIKLSPEQRAQYIDDGKGHVFKTAALPVGGASKPAEAPAAATAKQAKQHEPAIRKAYDAVRKANERGGGIVTVPDLHDQLKAQGLDLPREQFHGLLKQLQTDDRLTLQVVNDPPAESRAGEMIEDPVRGLLGYVRFRDQQPAATPKAAPQPKKIAARSGDKPTGADTSDPFRGHPAKDGDLRTWVERVYDTRGNALATVKNGDPLNLKGRDLEPGVDVEGATEDIIREVQGVKKANPFDRVTTRRLYQEVAKKHPGLSVMDFSTLLVRAQQARKIRLVDYTQAVGSIPDDDLRFVVPIDREYKGYVDQW